MVDDDSTALIIALQQEALASGVPLGVTTEHSKAIRENRKRAFAKAMEARNKELAAIAFGDGVDLSLEGVTISPDQVQQARQVADAMQRVLQVLRQEINSPNAAAKVGPVWQQHATLLLDEPCAANLRQTLTHMGVSVTPPAPAQPSSPSAPQETLSVEPVLVQIQREREQLDLERHFVRALRADDDQAIVSAHNDIQQSLYTEIITFTPQEKQRIGLAYQRQRVQFALKSTNAAQMAQAYELVANKPQIVSLSPQELQLLRIAHTFIVAYHTDTDEAILTAFDEMQHSPSYQFIKLTPQEEDRIGLAWKRRMAREHEQVNLDPIGNATLFPEGKHHPEPDEAKQMQGRSWFAKLMWWKGS